MKISEKIESIAAALAKAQGAFPAIEKKRKAIISTKSGKPYEYSYADLADVIAAVTPALSQNGLAIIQSPCLVEDKLVLQTQLMHASGEWISSHYPLKVFDRAQEMGSEITYARRYTLCAILGVHGETDDDGALASDAPAPMARPVAPILPPAPLLSPASGSDLISGGTRLNEADVSTGAVLCGLCKAQMKISKTGRHYFCANFKDTRLGEHAVESVDSVNQKLAAFNSAGTSKDLPPVAFNESDISF